MGKHERTDGAKGTNKSAKDGKHVGQSERTKAKGKANPQITPDPNAPGRDSGSTFGKGWS